MSAKCELETAFQRNGKLGIVYLHNSKHFKRESTQLSPSVSMAGRFDSLKKTERLGFCVQNSETMRLLVIYPEM